MWRTCLLCLGVLVLTSRVVQADWLTYRSASGDDTRRREVQVQRYEQGVFHVLVGSGATLRVPGERVVEFEFDDADPTSALVQGMAAWKRGEWQAARRELLRAVKVETRDWARFEILARLSQAAGATGDPLLACQAFLELVEADPTTRHLTAAPLCWLNSSNDAEFLEQCAAWQESQEPWAKLLGASWLLMTSERAQAAETLRGLSRSGDELLRGLAETQLWRAELSQVSEVMLEQWQERITTLPDASQAGGRWIIAQGVARSSPGDIAALRYLEVALGGHDQNVLIAESLYRAAEQLQPKAAAEAEQLLDELNRRFPESDANRLGQSLRKER